MELPVKVFSAQCAGCHGTVYGLEEEDCRQVRLPNMHKVIITLKRGILRFRRFMQWYRKLRAERYLWHNCVAWAIYNSGTPWDTEGNYKRRKG